MEFPRLFTLFLVAVLAQLLLALMRGYFFTFTFSSAGHQAHSLLSEFSPRRHAHMLRSVNVHYTDTHEAWSTGSTESHPREGCVLAVNAGVHRAPRPARLHIRTAAKAACHRVRCGARRTMRNPRAMVFPPFHGCPLLLIQLPSRGRRRNGHLLR